MIRVKRFSPTGQFEGYVVLDLAKPEVAAALQSSIAKGEGHASEMAKLDGQGISLARLLKLGFSVEEIRAATRRALAVIDRDLSDVERIDDELNAMLGPGFQGTQGGEAARSQFPGGVPGQRERNLREERNRGLKYDTKSQQGADIVKNAEAAWKASKRP